LNALWVSCSEVSWRKLKVSYNNSFRIVMSLRMRCSASGMFANFNVKSFGAINRSSVFSLMNRCLYSSNVLILMLFESATGQNISNIWRQKMYTLYLHV